MTLSHMAASAEIVAPLNAWYVASWDHELTHTLSPRTILGIKMVLYRAKDGSCVALEDACWHRLVPLSIGKLVGDEVQCGYHGLRYNSRGRCTFMPSQETINPSAGVRAFPVVEAHRFVWVWPGDPALADPAKIPDLHWMNSPLWAGDGRVIRPQCDYRLVADNLMDLTHETFTHAGTIGDDNVAEAPFSVTHGPGTTTVTRWMLDIDPPPFWRANYGKPGRVDRWQIIHFLAPCTVTIDVGVATAGTGAPQGDRSQGISMWVVNSATPQDATSCHYFWANMRNWSLHEQVQTHRIREAVSGIFHEDHVMLEAQQQAILDHPGHDFYNLNIDGGSMWARRIIDQMVAAERAPQAQAAE